MIEKTLAQWFKERNWTWKLKKGERVPTVQDVLDALDEAARMLYTEQVGAELHVARLIIKKKHRGHDVYVYVGPYE